MKLDFSGRIALVTGAGVGIGKEIAVMLGKCGANVALNYRNSATGAKEAVSIIKEAGSDAEAYQADLTDVQQINEMVKKIEERFGSHIDILINNAGGLIQRMKNTEITESLYNKVMDVNLKSTVFTSKAVIPGMKAKGTGKIVNITSLAAHNGGGNGAAIYAASKAAVMSYTKGLAKELAGDSIHVNAVSPGFIGETPFHDTFTTDEARKATIQSVPLRRQGVPDDVAGAVLFLVSDLSSYITGETIEVNGGLFMR